MTGGRITDVGTVWARSRKKQAGTSGEKVLFGKEEWLGRKKKKTEGKRSEDGGNREKKKGKTSAGGRERQQDSS